MEALLKNGAEIYAVAYFGALLVVALVEWVLPRRAASDLARVRWLSNFGLTVLGSALVRLLIPIAGVGWAIFCREQGLGLFNNVSWPAWIAFPATIVLIDLSHYIEHYLLHRVPVFWRLHRTHHTDLEYDFSTGVRFHPFENVFATLALMLVVAALGAPPAAVLISQVLTIVVDFIEHANVRMPVSIDRMIRLVLRHARHASDSPFAGAPRGQLELLEHAVGVGPTVRNLRRSAGRRTRAHRVRRPRVHRSQAPAFALDAGAALPGGSQTI